MTLEKVFVLSIGSPYIYMDFIYIYGLYFIYIYI